MRPDASDLRFFADDGTPLAYEIEQLGTAAGEPLVAWVRVPTILGTTTLLIVGYGYDRPPPQPDQSVWSDLYAVVWHLHRIGDAVDSTPNHRDGMAYGTQLTPEVVATGRSFAGTTDGIVIPGEATAAAPELTVPAWMQIRSPAPATGSSFYSAVARELDDSGSGSNGL